MKENMGIQAKNIPEKICDKRKTWWNRIIANNNLYNWNFFRTIRLFLKNKFPTLNLRHDNNINIDMIS